MYSHYGEVSLSFLARSNTGDEYCLYVLSQRFASEKEGDREVQRTMLELLNQLDGFSSTSDIKVSMSS